ncbi:hypothetical protein AOX56_14275 [Aeromonas sobria]|uniref:Type III secretion chaperone SycN n=1 Tax=Aeromonas sobria TaxID=646 RepID=A0A2N3J1B6_AERSO|nr:hypothetical protein [Aeromonas sobria]PKQ79311.1 hypothetical protein AOX56_14275 [Aeromonas sobria]
MLIDWLSSLGLTLPAAGESRVIRFEGAPELWFEKIEGQYVLALPLAPLPLKMLAGVMLLLLQVNSPLSTLQPVRLTVDGQGLLLLWCALDDHADPQACQVVCDLLHAGYHELLPLLQAQEESIPVRSGSLFV